MTEVIRVLLAAGAYTENLRLAHDSGLDIDRDGMTDVKTGLLLGVVFWILVLWNHVLLWLFVLALVFVDWKHVFYKHRFRHAPYGQEVNYENIETPENKQERNLVAFDAPHFHRRLLLVSRSLPISESQLRNQKRAPGCSGFTGDYISSYIGITSSTMKQGSLSNNINNQDSMECIRPGVFFSCV